MRDGGCVLKTFSGKSKKINYDKDLNLDHTKLLKNINKKTNLVVLANPNSPTGTIIDQKKLLKIIKLCKRFNFIF